MVAVKVDQRTLDTETEQRRFLREAGAAGRMSGYPGIVTVHDAGILADDRPFLVMQLCTGGSLTAWVKAEERPAQARVREVGVRVADALAAAHAQGVLHRDVKPANILIDDYGTAGLADFGLAALPDHGLEYGEDGGDHPGVRSARGLRSQDTDRVRRRLLLGRNPLCAAGRAPAPVARPPGADGGGDDGTAVRTDRAHPGGQAALHGPADVRPRRRTDGPSDGRAVPGPAPGPRADSAPAATATRREPPSRWWPTTRITNRRAGAGFDGADRSSPRRRSSGLRGAGGRVAWSSGWCRPSWRCVRPIATTGAPSQSTTECGADRAVGRADTGERHRRSRHRRSRHRRVDAGGRGTDEVPAGFVDCAESFGADTYCATENECYGSVGVYGVGLLAGVEADCDQTHIYQTFAAGRPWLRRRAAGDPGERRTGQAAVHQGRRQPDAAA